MGNKPSAGNQGGRNRKKRKKEPPRHGKKVHFFPWGLGVGSERKEEGKGQFMLEKKKGEKGGKTPSNSCKV